MVCCAVASCRRRPDARAVAALLSVSAARAAAATTAMVALHLAVVAAAAALYFASVFLLCDWAFFVKRALMRARSSAKESALVSLPSGSRPSPDFEPGPRSGAPCAPGAWPGPYLKA